MKKAYCALLALLWLLPPTLHAATHRDSVITALMGIEDDSIRLRQMFIYAQNHMDETWVVDLLDSGRCEAARQHHVAWELSFMGSKVRWAHRHHEWKRMDQYLKEQRAASFEMESVGNYMSQIAQSVIVLSGVGMFEQARNYIEQIKQDVKAAGAAGERNRAYIHLASAEYYQKLGEQEKCRDTYLEALRVCPYVTPSQRISIHNGLIAVYTELKEYEKALMHADSVIAIYYTFSADHQRVPNSRALLMECELNKADLYMRLGEYGKMRECMESAEASSEGVTLSLLGDLYYWWHRYHFLMGNYEKSLEYIELSAELLRRDHYHERAMQRDIEKVKSMWAMGYYGAALEHYAKGLCSLDSLHKSMIEGQHEYLRQVNEMLQEEEDSISMQLWASRIVIIVAIVLFLIIMGAVAYSLYSRRTLKRNCLVTHHKLEEAQEADQAKEQFLHNITTLINDPLQCVVSDAKRLAADTSLSAEERQEVLHGNKAHVERLMTLVNNVLDLSRLEAGMMKYATTDSDITLLIEDTARAHDNLHPDSPIEIKNEIGSFRFSIDTARFTSMLHTLFAVPADHPEWKPGGIVLQLRNGGDSSVILIVTGSYYCRQDITEDEQMTHRINSLFLNDFGATYAVGYGAITIVFPIRKSST